MFYYCYICERLKYKQELYIVLFRRSTAINHLIDNYYIDKITGKLFTKEVDLNQLILKAYLEARLLNLNYNFKAFKALLI